MPSLGLDLVRRGRSIAAISLVLIAGAGRARAQSAEAEALFNDGDKLMKEGKLAEACDAFEASNRLESRAGTLIRLGECREQNRQLASAWSAYKDALTRVKDPRKKEVALAKSTQLEAKLSYLTISVPDDSRVDGLVITRNGKVLDPALLNRALPVDGGEYVIGGSAPGHEEWRTTAVVPVENGKISVEVPKFKEISKLVTPPVPATKAAPPEPVEPTDTPSRFTGKRKLALGLAGVAAISAGVGIVLGIKAKGKRDDAFALCPDIQTPCADADRATALSQSGHNFSIGANVLFGVAGAAAIGAGILWFIGAPESPSGRTALAPSVGADHAGVMVFGAF